MFLIDSRAPLVEIGFDLLGRNVEAVGDELGADANQLLIADIGNRAIMERIRPDRRPARQTGSLDQPGRAMSIGNMQSFGHAPLSIRSVAPEPYSVLIEIGRAHV